jgi:hypothetical protein
MTVATSRASIRSVLLACAFVSIPPASIAQTQVVENFVEPFVEAVLTQLARRQGFNRLMLPDADAAVFGTAYYVDEDDVPCFSVLREMAQRGDPLPLNSLVQFATTDLPQPRVISEWTTIRISSLMGAAALAQVSAKVQDQQVSVGAMASAFKQTNAQILFASRDVPLLNYQRAARKQLQRDGVVNLHDVSPQASGVITPVSQLIVQKFEFDRQLVKKSEVNLIARFLELFGARIAGERSTNLLEGYQLPTNAVLAIKPGFVRFNHEVCPK